MSVEPGPEGTILDQPHQIEAWSKLALYYMLKLELKGMRHSSGTRASVAVRKILGQADWGAPRELRRLLPEYQAYLISLGILQPLEP